MLLIIQKIVLWISLKKSFSVMNLSISKKVLGLLIKPPRTCLSIFVEYICSFVCIQFGPLSLPLPLEKVKENFDHLNNRGLGEIRVGYNLTLNFFSKKLFVSLSTSSSLISINVKSFRSSQSAFCMSLFIPFKYFARELP